MTETERWEPPLWFDRVAGLAWRIAIILIAIGMIFALIVGLGSIVLPIVFGLLFAGMLNPIATRLRGYGAPRAISALGAVVVLIAFVGTVGYVGIRAIADQWDEITAGITAGVEELVKTAVDMGVDPNTSQATADQLTAWTDAVHDALISGVVSLVPYAASMIATLFLSVFVAFFFLKDGPVMWKWIVSRVSYDSGTFDGIGRGVWKTVSSFMIGQTIIAGIDAVFIGLGAFILGVPNASAVMMLTFIGAFVPYIGAFVAGLVGVLLAIADGGISKGLAMLAIVVVVQVIEGNVLQPWIQGRAVRLHPLVVALAVVAGGALAGFLGILLAVPVCAATVVTMGQLRDAGLLGTLPGSGPTRDSPSG